ncbi:Vps45 protein [Hanseniaspora uvarum]|nr:Vps45 protein [Hanseniaspora uvarum]
MNLEKVSEEYLNQIFNVPPKKLVKLNIKVLVLDDITTPILSTNCSQTKLLENDIYLVENLKLLSNFSQLDNRDTMRQLRCIVYISNTDESINNLCKELKNPKYGEYQIFLNNTVTKIQLEKLATNDHFEVVTSVINLYQDYIPLNQEFFYPSDQSKYKSLKSYLKTMSPGDPDSSMSLMFKNSAYLEGLAESLASTVISLESDVDVFYEKVSTKLAKPLALGVNRILREAHKNSVLKNQDKKDTCLLIVDRFSFDPVTPLLQPWTYQSMIKEYLGLDRYVVDMSKRDVDILKDDEENKTKDPVIYKQQQQLLLNPKEDTFFAKTMYNNYGDLNDTFQTYLADYKFKMKNKKTINDLQDIKTFILQYPEFNKLSKNVTKHMAIISELDSDLKKLNIWSVSEVEQNLVSQIHSDADYNEFLPDIVKIFDDEKIDFHYKIKLLLVFGLSNYKYLPKLLQAIEMKLPSKAIEFAKTISKQHQLQSSKLNSTDKQKLQSQTEVSTDFLGGLAKQFNANKNVDTGVPHSRNKDNIYMMHHGALEILIYKNDFLKNFQSVDFEDRALDTALVKNLSEKYKNIIFYVVGGITYEECRVVREFNSDFTYNSKGKKVLLGGTTFLSTQEYMNDLESLN